MTGPDYTLNSRKVPKGTLAQLFLNGVESFEEHAAVGTFTGDSSEVELHSYRDVYRSVRAAAAALEALGLVRGDRAAIVSEGRLQWTVVDFACLCLGIEDVPIYTSLTDDQVGYILGDSGVRLVFAKNDELCAKVLDAKRLAGVDVRVVSFEDTTSSVQGVMSWKDFLDAGRDRLTEVTDQEFKDNALGVTPDDLATIIYTSGTTGDPKGVMLTHNNLFSNVWAANDVFDITPTDSSLSFLPLSHVFQRMVNYLFWSVGCTFTYAHSVETVADDLKIVRPTVVVSVPRLYEKVYDRVMEADGFKRKLIDWAVKVGRKMVDLRTKGRRPGVTLRLQYTIADRLVFRKIRAGVGGRLRFFVSGGARLSSEVNRFFEGAGVKILQGYGLTETSPVTNVNTLRDFKIGAVGKAVPGTEIKIAADGEILIRGPQVMKGYLGKPEATSAAISPEGWFHTGDIGELDEEGYLRITDRKKDILVTAGGKNVAPQPIESRVVTNRYVEQAVMVGDGRKFVSMLLVPAFGPLEAWAQEAGLASGNVDELLNDGRVHELIASEVSDQLDNIARYEIPKKLVLLRQPFTLEDGSLTPTQKIKRKVIAERYRALIDSVYEEESADRTVFVEP